MPPAGPQVVQGALVTRSVPAVLRAIPALGGGFSSAPNAREALISHALWQQAFGGTPQVIGRTITLDGDEYSVMGVMRPGFSLPGQREGAVWVRSPFETPTRRGPYFLTALARLVPGISADAAGKRLTEAITPVLRDRF